MFGTFVSKVAAAINYLFGSSAPAAEDPNAATQAPLTMAATRASRYLRSSGTTTSPLSMIRVSALDAAYLFLQVCLVLVLLCLVSSLGSTIRAALVEYRLQRDSLVRVLAAENGSMGELAERNGATIEDLNRRLQAIAARHQRELDSASRQHGSAIDGLRSQMQQQLDHARRTKDMDQQTIRHAKRRLEEARVRQEEGTGFRGGALMRSFRTNGELKERHAADMAQMRSDHEAALLRHESMLKAARESANNEAEKSEKELAAANSENGRLSDEVTRLQRLTDSAAAQAQRKREAQYKAKIDVLESESAVDKARIKTAEGHYKLAERREAEANARANDSVQAYHRELEARDATIKDQGETIAANNALYLSELQAREKMIADNITLYHGEMVKRDATLAQMKAAHEKRLAARDKKIRKQEQMQKRLLARISALQAENAALKETAGVPPPAASAVPPPSASAVPPPSTSAVPPPSASAVSPPPSPAPSPLPSPLPTSTPLPASPQPAPAGIPLPPSPQPTPAEIPLPPSPQPAPAELPSPASPTPDAAAAPVANEPRAECGASSAITMGQISETEETPTAKTNAEVTEEAKKSPAETPVAPEETVDQTSTTPIAMELEPELASGVKAESPAAGSSSEAPPQKTSTEEVTMEEQPADDPMDTGLQSADVASQEAEAQQPMDTEDAPAQPPAAANQDAEMTDGNAMIHPIGQDSQGDQDMFGSEYIDLDHLMGMEDVDLSTPTGFDFDLSDPAAFNFDWTDPAAFDFDPATIDFDPATFNFDPAAPAPAPIESLALDHDVTNPVDQAVPMNDFDHWVAQFTGAEAASNDLDTQLDLDRILGPEPVVLAGTSDAHLAVPEASAHSDQPSNPGSAANEQSSSLPVISAEEQEQLDRDLAWQNLMTIVEGVRQGAPSAGPVETAPLPTSSEPREPNPPTQPFDTRSAEELARLPGGVVDQPPPAAPRRIAQPSRRRRGAGQQQQSGGANWNIDPALLNAVNDAAADLQASATPAPATPAPAAAAPETGPGLGRRIINPVHRRRPAGYRPFPVNAPGPSAPPPPQQQQQPLPLIVTITDDTTPSGRSSYPSPPAPYNASLAPSSPYFPAGASSPLPGLGNAPPPPEDGPAFQDPNLFAQQPAPFNYRQQREQAERQLTGEDDSENEDAQWEPVPGFSSTSATNPAAGYVPGVGRPWGGMGSAVAGPSSAPPTTSSGSEGRPKKRGADTQGGFDGADAGGQGGVVDAGAQAGVIDVGDDPTDDLMAELDRQNGDGGNGDGSSGGQMDDNYSGSGMTREEFWMRASQGGEADAEGVTDDEEDLYGPG
ncbi:MAG: hypothetical protein LQ344_004275 [Seirophora lacunosa]|nr:MAG: hypothetical protein LQ344_004275 [Seirophora lacunosa]